MISLPALNFHVLAFSYLPDTFAVYFIHTYVLIFAYESEKVIELFRPSTEKQQLNRI